MIIMHLMILAMFCLLFGMVAVVSLVDSVASNPEIPRNIKAASFVITAFLACWCIGFATRTERIEVTEILTPYDVVLPNGQIIQNVTYMMDNRPITINLNDEFRSQIKSGVNVRRIVPSSGPYCGISVYGTYLCNSRFELVK